MNAMYTDLLAILDYAGEQIENNGGEDGTCGALAGITTDNVRYIRGVVEGAIKHVKPEGAMIQ